LGRRWSAWLSYIGGYSGGKKILFEVALADQFFQVPPEASAVIGLVSLAFMEGTIIFRSRKCGVIMDQLRAPYL